MSDTCAVVQLLELHGMLEKKNRSLEGANNRCAACSCSGSERPSDGTDKVIEMRAIVPVNGS